jgi:ribonuclease HI
MKINVDAAMSKNTGKASYAAVARNSSSQFLGASIVAVMGMSDPETLEAMAVREGLALASDLALQSFGIASDNAGVVPSISESAFGQYGQIIKEIKARATTFTDFVNEGRLSNGDAHRVARGSLFEDVGGHLWLLGPPEGVRNSYHVVE